MGVRGGSGGYEWHGLAHAVVLFVQFLRLFLAVWRCGRRYIKGYLVLCFFVLLVLTPLPVPPSPPSLPATLVM